MYKKYRFPHKDAMFQPKIENAEFISRVEHLLSKMDKYIPKSNITLILATHVFIEQIESKSF